MAKVKSLKKFRAKTQKKTKSSWKKVTGLAAATVAIVVAAAIGSKKLRKSRYRKSA